MAVVQKGPIMKINDILPSNVTRFCYRGITQSTSYGLLLDEIRVTWFHNVRLFVIQITCNSRDKTQSFVLLIFCLVHQNRGWFRKGPSSMKIIEHPWKENEVREREHTLNVNHQTNDSGMVSTMMDRLQSHSKDVWGKDTARITQELSYSGQPTQQLQGHARMTKMCFKIQEYKAILQ